jgi:cobalt-zinc-cadmium efflux system outer membrane protein
LSCAILLASAGVFSARIVNAQTPAPAAQTPAQAQAPPSIAIVPPQTPAPTGEPLTLEGAFARAVSANPMIAAARLKRAINLASIDVAGERPNPDLHAEVERETPKQDAGIALPIELGGKRGRRVAVAQAVLQAGEAELTATILDIRNQVRRAYFNRLLAEARFSVLDEVRQFAVRARDAAQARFDVGSAPRLELLQAQLQLAQAENEQASAQATTLATRISLNALLGLPLDSNLPLATGLDAAPNLIGAAALQIAQSANAELAVLDRQIEEQRAKVALAQALRTPDVIPDFTVAHAFSPGEFVWGWRVAATATIPVFTSHRAAVRVEEASLTQLNAQRGAVLARVTGDVTSASALAEAERLAYLRYRDQILPQTLEVERMAEDSYRLGQTNIVALLQALQTSRTIRLQSLQTAQDFQNALSDLERAIGAPIP